MSIVPDVEALKAQITAEFPSFSMHYKKDSLLMRLIGFFAGADFMSSYVTTLWSQTVYLPSNWDSYGDDSKCSLLRHERVHMRQAKKLTYPLFAFLYLLVFFPIGLAYFRARFEMEAYTESLAADKDYGDDYSSADKRAWWVGHFTSSAYGYMWPFPSTVGKWFDQAVSQLNSSP